MNKNKITYYTLYFTLLVISLLMVFISNNEIGIYGWILFISLILFDQISEIIYKKNTVRYLEQTNKHYIKIKPYSTTLLLPVLWIFMVTSNMKSLYDHKSFEGFINDGKEINGFIDFLNVLNSDDKIIILVNIGMLIFAVMMTINYFIDKVILTDEYIAFSRYNSIKYSDINSLEYRNTFFSFIDKNKIVRINTKKREYSLVVKSKDFNKIVEYLTNKTNLEFVYEY